MVDRVTSSNRPADGAGGAMLAEAPDAEQRQPRVITGGPSAGETLRKAADAHKYDHGHAVVFSGGMGQGGAARLAARGALRVGSGLVTVAVPGAAIPESAAHLTAIMVRQCDGPDAIADLLADTRINALCLGPGLGVSDRTCAMVKAALAARRATVLDADALTSFANCPDALFDALHPSVVLTPHMGEFARLFPDLAGAADQDDDGGRVSALREACSRAQCVVLLKGPATLIAAPSGAVWINDAIGERATPWLATAGSGDVLAGFITGLLARGLGAERAACLGTWLHVEAARAFGPGLIAEDLPEILPSVFRHLGV